MTVFQTSQRNQLTCTCRLLLVDPAACKPSNHTSAPNICKTVRPQSIELAVKLTIPSGPPIAVSVHLPIGIASTRTSNCCFGDPFAKTFVKTASIEFGATCLAPHRTKLYLHASMVLALECDKAEGARQMHILFGSRRSCSGEGVRSAVLLSGYEVEGHQPHGERRLCSRRH